MPTTNPAAESATITQLQSFKLGDGPSDSAMQVEGRVYNRYASPRNPGPNPDAVHPWERMGLGVAPYKCVGVGTAIYRAVPEAPAQPGASCDFCGQGIMNVYSVQAACKSVFKVGCDCVRKTCSEKEGVRTAIESADRKHRNAVAKTGRDKRDAAAKDDLATIRAKHADALAAMPHPKAAEMPAGSAGQLYFAGMSALDWLDHMMRCCGASGRARLVKTVKAMIH